MCLKSCWFGFFLGSTTSSSTLHNEAEVGDDDVFTVSTPKSFSFGVRLRKSFSFYASGLAFSHHRVWTLGCVLFDGSISPTECEASCCHVKSVSEQVMSGLEVKK